MLKREALPLDQNFPRRMASGYLFEDRRWKATFADYQAV